MSAKKKTKVKEDDREYKVPKFKKGGVWNANWRDDVPEESDDENAQVKYEFYGDEKKYRFTGRLTDRAKELLAVRALKNRLSLKGA